MAYDESWSMVWQRKGLAIATGASDPPTAVDLLHANGFDTATGTVSLERWGRRAREIADGLGLFSNRGHTPSRVLDVGCGAGAMLLAMRDAGAHFTGVDPSTSLLRLAKRALPEASFVLGTAQAIPFAAATFDAVFAHSVFAYFGDQTDVDGAVSELIRVSRPNAPIAILDVPDLATKDACELERRRLVGSDDRGRGGLQHLYVPRQRLVDAARAGGRSVVFIDGADDFHPMSRFRYDAWLRPVHD